MIHPWDTSGETQADTIRKIMATMRGYEKENMTAPEQTVAMACLLGCLKASNRSAFMSDFYPFGPANSAGHMELTIHMTLADRGIIGSETAFCFHIRQDGRVLRFKNEKDVYLMPELNHPQLVQHMTQYVASLILDGNCNLAYRRGSF